MIDFLALAAWVLAGMIVELRTWRCGGLHLRQLGPAAFFGPLWLVGRRGRRATTPANSQLDEVLAEGSGDAAVVVGFDGTDGSVPATRWAAERALQLGVPLRIVHAFSVTAPSDAAGAYARVYGIAVDAAERKVAEAAARISESFPGLAVETAVAAGSAPLVLERNCSDAALLVLATRQQNAVRQWIGRSVTNRVTGRVRCPVVSLPLASA